MEAEKRIGRGALYDMGVYSIQGARLGANMEPVSVLSAVTSTTRPEIYKNGLDETTEAVLQFPDGVIGNIKTSFGENVNFLNISCDKGDIKMAPFQSYNGLKGSSPLGEIHHPYQVPMQQAMQMDNDAKAIIEGKPMMVPGEEGLRDIRIVEAIYKSAASKKEVKL